MAELLLRRWDQHVGVNSGRVLRHWPARAICTIGLVLGLTRPCFAVDPTRAQSELADAVDTLVGDYRGQVAILIRHLDSGAEFAYRADEPMPTASLIKLPVMIAAYQRAEAGQLDLTKRVTFRNEDRAPGSGILSKHFAAGLQLTVRDCLRLMIAYSDNSATNLVLQETGLLAVNDLTAKLGCPKTTIHALVFHPESSISPADSQKWGLGKTTARETASLLQRLERGQLGKPEHCREMLDHLAAAEDRSRLGLLLPEGTRIALKTGAVTSARTVAGIVYSPGGAYVVCVLTAENKDRRWSDENAAYRLFAEVARSAWKIFNPDPTESTASPPDGRLALGSQGALVEDLQRTLNVRLANHPQTTVDGEFGPQTEQAVRALQRQAGIAESGVTDAATWKALNPLVLAARSDDDDPEAEPAKEPADPVDGPPVVSCRSWILGDPHSGEILAGHDAETPRDFASTTKIMTAYVVLKCAEQDATCLDGEVIVSHAADETPGSTAGIRRGEICTVRELLFGLMLPSGNDASVALAEHFGSQLAASADAPSATPQDRFIAEMNRTAAQLGMTHTKYANPHGLTHPDHHSTARDLFRLVCAALKMPQFREIVDTRRHRSLITGPGGYQREVLWTNTNRLLGQEGFAGVKTGTTSAAGACLVSLSRRDDREAVAVVLGATSTDARYIDTRNLFRWYWQQSLAK